MVCGYAGTEKENEKALVFSCPIIVRLLQPRGTFGVADLTENPTRKSRDDPGVGLLSCLVSARGDVCVSIYRPFTKFGNHSDPFAGPLTFGEKRTNSLHETLSIQGCRFKARVPP